VVSLKVRGGGWRGGLFHLGLFAIALAAGYLLSSFLRPALLRDETIRENSGGLTNPLLDLEVGGLADLQELRPFREEIEKLIGRIREKGLAEKVTVYFRDLENGIWLGVGEHEEFAGGSLYKLPLVIACLKQAEQKPAFLGKRSVFRPPPHPVLLQPHFPPALSRQPGKEYTVRELIELVARYSDNNAAYLLQETVDRGRLERTIADLGLDPKRVIGGEHDFSVEEFGRFFRILYNASYLDREKSEMALEFFTQSAFSAGLAAGVPPGTLIAHKFGESVEDSPAGRRDTLHDCGIVYFPGKPYLLCVMTRGSDFDKQALAIAAVSSLVYRQVRAQVALGSSD
jgi:beta-lactamase class A